MTDEIDLGQFVVGEKPNPLVYQFNTSAGVPISLSGYSAVFEYREFDGSAISVSGTKVQITDATNGQVTYFWDGTELTSPGRYQAMFWVGNGVQRYASWLIKWTARISVGAVPNI